MRKNKYVIAALAAGLGLSASAVQVAVDFAQEVGPVKRLNGVCNLTPLANSRTKSINDMVLKLEVPGYHLHDAALENPGLAVVDVSRIFPLFHADVDDPRNYIFEPTDDYLRQAVEAGAEIDFRLGESIEHSKNTYRVHAPKDYAKWAEICAHIIRHYNEGWANGFRWNIRKWSIWEEPDTNPMLLTGAKDPFTEIYLPLYAAAATRLKKEFPEIEIGGPQTGSNRGLIAKFIDYCAANKLPIDNLGFTGYSQNVDHYANMVSFIRGKLDEKGFTRTKISVVEWHWGPLSWVGHGTANAKRNAVAWRENLTSYESAAFTAATLIRMQDAPVDNMYFYAMKCGCWGLFDADRHPYPCYWAMYAFAQLAHGRTRVKATVDAPGWYALASKEADGKGHVLVSTLATGVPLALTVSGGMKPVRVRTLDPVSDMEDSSAWTWNEAKGELSLRRDFGNSAVFLIDFDRM